MRTSGSRRATTWIAVSAVVALAFASMAPAGALGRGKELSLTFGSASVRSNAGSANLAVRQVTRNGGTVDIVQGRGGDWAARLPAYRSGDPRFAVLAVSDVGGPNDLAPGLAAFRFGADFALDAQHQGGTADNGNNLVQRGLFGDAAQYKLDVDDGRPGCRVKGTAGALAVRSTRTVRAGAWYRAWCTRDGSTLTLRVLRLGDRALWTYRAHGTTGQVVGPDGTALSVGGKLDAPDRISENSDQFNGIVDNAFLNVYS